MKHRADALSGITCGSDFPLWSSWRAPFQRPAAGRAARRGRAAGRGRAAVWRKGSGAEEAPATRGWSATGPGRGRKSWSCQADVWAKQLRLKLSQVCDDLARKQSPYKWKQNKPPHDVDCLLLAIDRVSLLQFGASAGSTAPSHPSQWSSAAFRATDQNTWRYIWRGIPEAMWGTACRITATYRERIARFKTN